MTRVRFSREARSELLAQTAYYETARAGLGARFRQEAEKAAHLAAEFPEHGRPGPAGTRSRALGGFPFRLFYTAVEAGILIHAVAGDRQMPAYWIGRMPVGD